jgi:hypothetical protein
VVFIGLIGFKFFDLKFEVLFLCITVILLSTATWALLLLTGGIECFWVWPSFIVSYVVAGIIGIVFFETKELVKK